MRSFSVSGKLLYQVQKLNEVWVRSWYLDPLAVIVTATGFISYYRFQAWWLEPLIASAAFTAFIGYYRRHERRNKCNSLTAGRGWQSDDVQAGIAYWIGIIIWKACVPPPTNMWDGTPTTFSQSLYFIAELVSGIVAYDAIFFFLHWAMHEIPLVCRWLGHAHHHWNTKSEAVLVLHHSLPDGILQVLVNILVQRTTPWGCTKSRFARLCHNVILIWMLVESHTRSPTPYLWRRWFSGVRNHAKHHESASHHSQYQQFFGYLDQWRLQYCHRQHHQKKRKV